MKRLLVLSLFLLGFALGSKSQAPSYIPKNGLIAWYPFNGNANDESGNSNNGTNKGAILVADRFGQTNSAFYFNGKNFNHISIANNPDGSLNLTNDFTISSWFNSDSMYTQESTVRSILSKGGDGIGSPNGYIYGIWGGTTTTNDTVGMINFQAQPFGNTATYPSGNVGDVNIKRWYNFVVTFTKINSTLKYYLNGVQVDTKILNFSIGQNNNELWVGSQSSIYSTVKTFHGKIDDIGIWNRALTQEEIKAITTANICYEYITVTDTLLIKSGLTGFNPVTYINTIKIFPNPTKDHITIDYGNYLSLNGYKLKIVNSLGQIMFESQIIQQSSYINLSQWTGNRIYFVYIIDPQGNILDIKKIILQ